MTLITELDPETLRRITFRGELNTLNQFEMVAALEELATFSAKALADAIKPPTRGMRQEDLANRVAELACATFRDANIAIIAGLDSGVLTRDAATREIQLPQVPPNSR